MSNDNLRVMPVAFFAADFNLSYWEFLNLTFTLSYSVILSNKIDRMHSQYFHSFSQKIQDSFFDLFKTEGHFIIIILTF